MKERRLRQVDPAGFVKTHRQIEFFAFRPQRIVIGIAPFFVVDVIGAEKNAAKTVFFYRAADFFDRAADVVGRDHGDAIHALRIRLGEIMQPVVISTGDGGGEVGIEAVHA